MPVPDSRPLLGAKVELLCFSGVGGVVTKEVTCPGFSVLRAAEKVEARSGPVRSGPGRADRLAAGLPASFLTGEMRLLVGAGASWETGLYPRTNAQNR